MSESLNSPCDEGARLRRGVYLILIALSVGNMAGRILSVNSVNYFLAESNRISARLKKLGPELIEKEKKRSLAHLEEKLKAGGLAGPELEAKLTEQEKQITDEEILSKPEFKEKYAKEERRIRAALRMQRPFLSANDRSRWNTVRALVEQGTYAIDQIEAEKTWDTIDKVQHKGRDGKLHLYSSKPPLLPTLMAAEYWVIYHTTGWTLKDEPFLVGRIMLLSINVTAMVVFFMLLSLLVERYGTTDWGRIFVMAAACLGTFLTTFSVVINNHTIAATSAMIALYAALRIYNDEKRELRWFVLAGFFAAFTAANELPALSFAVFVGAALLWRFWRQTLVGFVPAALVVLVAFFGTNYAAHQTLRPAYMHRQEGKTLFLLATGFKADLEQGQMTEALRKAFADHFIELTDAAEVTRYKDPLTRGQADVDKWVVTDRKLEPNEEKYMVLEHPNGLDVHAWDNWYYYSYRRKNETKIRTSYWQIFKNRSRIDQGQSSRARYALHVLVGHHGIFSLTPVWLLSVVGVVMLLRNSKHEMRHFAILVTVLTVVCLTFYIARPQTDRNYGGMSSGFRWMFWFAPMWLVAMLPAADWMSGKRLWRAVALVLLSLSVLSASYPTWNPWTHPWFLNFLKYLGLSNL